MTYRGPLSFTQALDQQAQAGLSGNASEYVIFSPVTEKQLERIEKIRDTNYKELRFTYLKHPQELIVMPGRTHEIANRAFTGMVTVKAAGMGLQFFFVNMGSATIKAVGGQKEGDSTFCPVELRSQGDSWPTLVIECGVSQCLTSLVHGSHWWFEKSFGDVKIVVLISVSMEERRLHVQKWEAVLRPNPRITRANPRSHRVAPVITQEIDIVGNVVSGSPLVLEFEKIMLREPGYGEADMIFNIQELRYLASLLWRFVE
ncbi:hypothetical protein HOY82DRAFT_508786 [Tuber indicum]|nr:hypothetical protein HOY82DRAFT_508786 [Tuber indicum]